MSTTTTSSSPNMRASGIPRRPSTRSVWSAARSARTSGPHRALEVLALRAADQTLLVDGLLGIPGARIFGEDVVVVVDIRREGRAVLLHEADPFVVEQRAVLDRGDARPHGPLDGLRAVRMGSHLLAPH